MNYILSIYKRYEGIILFCNATLSLILIQLQISKSPYFLYFVSLLIFIFNLTTKTRNIIFFIRTFFIGIVGFLAISTKLISHYAFFGFHLQESQTLEIATLMFLLTNIALFANELGLNVGEKIKTRKENFIRYENKTFFYVLVFITLIVAYLISKTHTGIIGAGGSYGHGGGAAMPINNLNSISNILFYTLVLLYFKYKNYYNNLTSNKIYYSILFCGAFLYLYAEFLRGVRMDALNGIFGTAILYSVYQNKEIKITPKLFFLGIFLFLMVQIMGILRSALNVLKPDEIYDLVLNNLSYLIKNPNNNILFYQGTINDIATTFSGTIMLLKDHTIDFMYGQSYFDYILRTPPQFLYPNRPQDLAWIFANNGYTSGGGFFELAEAYLNFSVFGAFIVPFFISFMISFSYKQFTINKYSIFHSILLFSILSAFLRGLLYQSFAFWKSIVTGFILYAIFYLILGLINIIKPRYGKS